MGSTMRDKILKKLATLHSTYPGRMLVVVSLLTVIFVGLSTQLKLTLRWSDLLPSNDKRTLEFNKIIEEFRTATSIVIVVTGEERRIKQFADTLVPRLLSAVDTGKNVSLWKDIEKLNKKIKKLESESNQNKKIKELQTQIEELHSQINRRLIQRVDYKAEIGFLRKHGLMLMKEDDLENIKEIFTDPNLTDLIIHINNAMEKEYVGKSESISTREKEDQAVMFLDGIQNMISKMDDAARNGQVEKEQVHAVADKLLLGEPYFLSYDKTTLILNAIPTFTVMDLDLLVSGTETIQSILDDLLKDYPDISAGLTGMIPLCHDEMVYSMKSLSYTSLIAVVAILLLLIISLKMWVAPIFAMGNLLIGILWAVGVTTVVVGQLNLMTQMMAVILLGLGIDFSIHIISGFTERRAVGDTISRAMEETFLKSGKGIVTGALTTAFAFLTMIISSSRGMKEMGLVTGTGLLAILFATFLVLPIFLVFRERLIDKKRRLNSRNEKLVQRDISFRFLGHTAQWLSRHYGITILASIILTILLAWSASRITFDQNYMNIEPEGLTSIVLQDTLLEKYDLSMDYALVSTDNVDNSRRMAKTYRELGSVAMAEDISLYLPSIEQQNTRTPHITEIQQSIQSAQIRPSIRLRELPGLIREIQRLEMNIMEMQDMAYLGGQDKVDNKCKEVVGDPDVHDSRNLIQDLLAALQEDPTEVTRGLSRFQRFFGPHFKTSVLQMCSTQPIRLDDLPESILDRYSNRSRDQFLITVYPAGNIWQDAQFLNRFTDDLENVSDRATGMPPVFRALIEIIGRDGRNAMVLTLIIVFLILWLDFQNPKVALIAMIPLAAGALWMVGLMRLTGQQFTVMNVMGFPMIIGIGIDDGVHIMHRWISEGRGHIRTIFASTGKAILLTTLTTMLAFGSLIFSIWRGFGQLGGALFVGVAACFLTTVIILSSILGYIERKR